MILISLFSHDFWSLNPVDTTNLFLVENEWYWYLYFPMIYSLKILSIQPTSFCERMNDIDISIFTWFMGHRTALNEWMILISLFSHDLWSLNPVDTTNLFLWENEWYWYLYFPMIYSLKILSIQPTSFCERMNDIDISIFTWFMGHRTALNEWMILISLFSHDLWSLNPVDTTNLFLWENEWYWYLYFRMIYGL